MSQLRAYDRPIADLWQVYGRPMGVVESAMDLASLQRLVKFVKKYPFGIPLPMITSDYQWMITPDNPSVVV